MLNQDDRSTLSDIGATRAINVYMEHNDFGNEFVDVLNTTAYANPSPPQGESRVTNISELSPYENNEQFWTDIIHNGHRKAGKHISLKEFHLTEWIARSPGTYFLPESRTRRERVKEEFFDHNRQEYVPEGKGEMVLAGVGSLRLDYRPIDGKEHAFLGATSDGITHEGIPVAVQKDKHEKLIDKIRDSGGCICKISGKLEVLPDPFQLNVEYHRRIPKFYLMADEIDFRNYSEKNSLRTSVAIIFAKDILESNQKLWSFCTFNPSDNKDLERAVDWLWSYATRYSRVDNPQILGDFDVYYEHFSNHPVEFPVRELARGNINMEKINRYRTSGVQVMIDRSVKIYGPVTNSPLYTGDFNDSVSTTYSGAGTVNPNDPEEWHNKGSYLVRLGRPEEAIECYDKALELKPYDANVWNNKGMALRYLRRYEEAIACYDKALEIDPNHASASNNKRLTLSDLSR
jgi:tetratricopeptide (TPR) repeat protein